MLSAYPAFVAGNGHLYLRPGLRPGRRYVRLPQASAALPFTSQRKNIVSVEILETVETVTALTFSRRLRYTVNPLAEPGFSGRV
jgi:hypothetical protein